MRIHAVVLVAALALTAGCAAIGGQPPDATATTPAPTETRTDEPCRTDLLLTSDGNDHVTPKPLPEERPELTPEAVAQSAREYERAFAHNHDLGERVREVTVELQGTTVRSVDDGFRVRVHVWTRTVVDPPAGATVTEATTRESFYDAHYFVSGDVLRRAETERHGTLPDPDLSRSGVTLSCWDG
ncbi:hypothetical protein HZS55_18500 [Halosimplex rubrum]|uniref:Lipoprotein n=1 Tax=Halosimplex rubrum TaxID=869889 RepID=A0A7D5P7C3_9EURY|nr:hypothetical protein [Halosimplex rubrum]QLH79158.1 hypothetical protein HZS55_18500 [Halosimplex rubrum]